MPNRMQEDRRLDVRVNLPTQEQSDQIQAIVNDLMEYFKATDAPKPLAAIAMMIIIHQLQSEGIYVQSQVIPHEQEMH